MWNLMSFQDLLDIEEAMELITDCMVLSMVRE